MSEIAASIKKKPHWRIGIRPAVYKKDLLPSLKDCLTAVERHNVHIRGWDFPFVGQRSGEQAQGNNWVGSWSGFSCEEFWRFYQSGQFIFLASFREMVDEEWGQKLLGRLKSRCSWKKDFDWSLVPGVLSIGNFTYTVAEVFEFATRLSQAGVYTGEVVIEISLKGVKGFALMADENRAWHSLYQASEANIGNTWSIQTPELIAKSKEYSLAALGWFFERFGWLEQPTEVFRKDLETYLSGKD